MNTIFMLLFAARLAAETTAAQSHHSPMQPQDKPALEPPVSLRTAVFVRALHSADYMSDERMESQAVQAGLYADGSSIPDSAGELLYSFNGAVMLRISENKDRKEDERPPLVFEPGTAALAGVTLCDSNSCGWTVGRGIPGQGARVMDSFTGSHGPRAGTSFYFQGKNAVLHLTPWFLPDATGGGLDGLLQGRPVRTEGSGRGARIAGGVLFRYGGIAFHYESSARRQTLRDDVRGKDILELAGIGFLLRKEDGFFRGRFLAGAEHSSGRQAAATNDERGSPFARIAGSALRSGASLAIGQFHWNADFFLPEPPSPSSGRRTSKEGSGYVAYGDAIGPDTVLRSAQLEPFPSPCSTCTGPDPRKLHAGVLQTEVGWQSESSHLKAEFRILRPLQAQEKTHGNPLRRTRRDPAKIEYHEASVLAGFKHASGSLIARYSRMHGRKNGRSFLAAESAEISFMRYF